MTCSFDRRGRSRRAAPPLRASTWAVTVTGDPPPPTHCPAPSQSSPRAFLAGPLTNCRRVQTEKSEAGMRAARPQCGVGSRGAPTDKPVTGAAVCAWRGVWVPRLSPAAGDADGKHRLTDAPRDALQGAPSLVVAA